MIWIQIPSIHVEILGIVVCACNSGAGGKERKIPETCWQASLTNQFPEKPCLKNKVESDREMLLMLTSGLHRHTHWWDVHLYTHPYTYRQKDHKTLWKWIIIVCFIIKKLFIGIFFRIITKSLFPSWTLVLNWQNAHEVNSVPPTHVKTRLWSHWQKRQVTKRWGGFPSEIYML